MYTNSFFISMENSLVFVFFVEEDDRFRKKLENIEMSKRNTAISTLSGSLSLVLNKAFIIQLNDKIVDNLMKCKKAQIAVNILGEHEIRIIQDIDVPEIFIGQIIAYSQM